MQQYSAGSPETAVDELEFVELSVGGELFGVEVTLVTEMMRSCPVRQLQNAQPHIEGVFKSRDRVITVIDLGGYLGVSSSDDGARDVFVIIDSGETAFALHAHAVLGIRRIPAGMLQKTDPAVYGTRPGIVTAVADFEGRLIALLDPMSIWGDLRLRGDPEPDEEPYDAGE